MKILLDTHIILWALTDDTRLSEHTRVLIEDLDNMIYFSLASVWEIALKNYKAPEKCPYNENEIAELCIQSGFEQLSIKQSHINGLRDLRIKADRNLMNYDPFDRMLLSQAKCEDMKLISHDSNFENYEENCIIMA